MPYLVGGRVMWRPPLEGLQLGSSLQMLRFDYAATLTSEQQSAYAAAGQLPENFTGLVTIKFPAKLWVASLEYQSGGLLLAAEYMRSYYDLDTNLRLPNDKIVNQGGY